MTKSQERKVAELKEMVIRDTFFSDNYEFKRWEVEEWDTLVYVAWETGLKGDEGTLGAIIGRDSGRVFIGKRGGMRYPTEDKNGNYITRPFESVLATEIAQRH